MNNKLKQFTLNARDLSVFGSGLTRPECVRADQEGVWASDDRGGIARVTQGESRNCAARGFMSLMGTLERQTAPLSLPA